MKMLLGNAFFAAIMAGWYFYVESDKNGGANNWMLSGAIMAFVSYLCGIVMGYLLRGAEKPRPSWRRQASQYGTGGFPVGIPVAYPQGETPHSDGILDVSGDATADATLAVADDLPLPVVQDIPGPDELDVLEMDSKMAAAVALDVFEPDPPPALPPGAHTSGAAVMENRHIGPHIDGSDFVPTID